MDLVDGAAIFSAGGGGSPNAGYKLVEELTREGIDAQLVAPSEIPENVKIINFACVGATATVKYESSSAVKTLRALEEYVDFPAFAVIPVELGGFNTVAAVDVAARCGIPIVDADGAGRSVPEMHLKVYTIDEIPLTPMVIADFNTKNIVIMKETASVEVAEKVARTLAAEWNNSAYTARRILTGAQVMSSPVQLSLSRSIEVGKVLRKAVEPLKAILRETGGYELFEGFVKSVSRRTAEGFTFTNVTIRGTHEYRRRAFQLRAKNEVLAAHSDQGLAALAPDIITPVHPETGRCVTAEKIEKGNWLSVLGIPAPERWRTAKGLSLWRDVLEREGIRDEYVAIEKLVQKSGIR